ncbi:MAG: hypothetical protein JWO32_2962 [Bacteroidetes bacterium]|nr:hypothetical protein [Bacteroidota bacterium]
MTNIIEEIKDLKNDPTHRSALRIFNLLDNNKEKFLTRFEADFFKNVHSGFEGLAYASPANSGSSDFKNQYNKLFEMFLYRINRL